MDTYAVQPRKRVCTAPVKVGVRSERQMGKKKKAHGPRRKRMSKAARLNSARSTRWVENYTGKSIMRGYRNWYGVDEMCAVIELRELGVPIPAEREAELREKAARRRVTAAGRKQRKKELCEVDEHPDSDGTFAFIAGYTPAGFAYGTTWEELGETPPWVQKPKGQTFYRDASRI